MKPSEDDKLVFGQLFEYMGQLIKLDGKSIDISHLIVGRHTKDAIMNYINTVSSLLNANFGCIDDIKNNKLYLVYHPNLSTTSS